MSWAMVYMSLSMPGKHGLTLDSMTREGSDAYSLTQKTRTSCSFAPWVAPRGPSRSAESTAPTNSQRVFALIQTKDQGSVWKSDDSGENWHTVNYQRPLIGRAGYYIRIAVSSGSDNEVFVANSSFYRSLDGGEVFQEVPWGG